MAAVRIAILDIADAQVASVPLYDTTEIHAEAAIAGALDTAAEGRPA